MHLSTHFLENVIDANQYPLPEITDLAQRIRRIGLGVMGLADLFVRLGVAYDTEEGVELGRKIQAVRGRGGEDRAERLAAIRGVFPEWEQSIWGPDDDLRARARGERIRPMRRLRNCNVTTVAPTGTISIIAGCSSGIEPLFAVAFMRNQAGVLMPDVNEDFVAIAKQEGWYSDELMRRIAEAGHINFAEVPEKWQRVFVTANDIKPEWHIRMQAAFQEYNDSAISQDLQLRPRRDRGVRRGDLPAGVRAQLQGRHGLPRRQPRDAGALHRQHGEEGARAGDSSGKSEARADLAEPRATADLHGELAELRAENERLGRSCTSSRRRTSSGGRSARGRSCSAAPPGGWRPRSARSTSPSPRTTAASRSRSS